MLQDTQWVMIDTGRHTEQAESATLRWAAAAQDSVLVARENVPEMAVGMSRPVKPLGVAAGGSGP